MRIRRRSCIACSKFVSEAFARRDGIDWSDLDVNPFCETADVIAQAVRQIRQQLECCRAGVALQWNPWPPVTRGLGERDQRERLGDGELRRPQKGLTIENVSVPLFVEQDRQAGVSKDGHVAEQAPATDAAFVGKSRRRLRLTGRKHLDQPHQAVNASL